MNGLHDLLGKLKKLEETGVAPVAASAAPVAATQAVDPDEAKYAAYQQKIEAQKAQAGLVAKLQGMLFKRDDPNVPKGYFIDPTNGLIGWNSPYGGRQGGSQTDGRPELLRFDQADTGIHKDVKQLLASAGIKVVPSQNIPGILNYSGGYASVPIDQVKMIQSGKLPNQTQPAAVVAQPAAVVAQPAAVVTQPAATPVAAADAEIRRADQSISAQAQNGALSNQFPAQPAVQATTNGTATAPVLTGAEGLNQFRDLVKKGMAKLSGTAESIVFRSSIGRALLESFDLKLNERVTPAEMASGLTTAEIALGDKLAQSYGDSEDTEIQGLLQQWSQIKNNMIRSQPMAQTQADVVNTITATKPEVEPAPVPPAAGDRAGDIQSTSTSTEPATPAKTPSPEVAKLATDNNIKDPNVIMPGQKITLPDGRTYTVVPGDNLTDILAGKGKGTYVKPESAAQKAPPKNVTQVSPDAQNMAGTKSTLKPDEIKAAQEALKDPSISARDKAYYTELLKNQPASATGDIADQARPGLDPKKGKPEVYDRQKQLAALGAKMKDGVTPLGTDGVRGNDTIKAEKEFGSMIIDPKTEIRPNGPHGVLRPVNPADIKSIQSWIKAVKEQRKKMEEVPPVYMDIVKKQLAIKESTGFTNDELSRIVSLVHHR